MYRITYGRGNGYHCSCCRRTSEYTVDCDTEEEVVEWLSKLAADKELPSCEDADDRWLVEIREIKNEDLTSKFQANPERVKKLVAKVKAAKRRLERAREKEQEQREIEELKRLQEQYPNA